MTVYFDSFITQIVAKHHKKIPPQIKGKHRDNPVENLSGAYPVAKLVLVFVLQVITGDFHRLPVKFSARIA